MKWSKYQFNKGNYQKRITVYDFLDERIWLSMLRDRNDMAYIYDGAAAERLVGKILNEYIPELMKLQKEVEIRYRDVLETL